MDPRFKAGMDWICPQRPRIPVNGGIFPSGETKSWAAGEALSARIDCRARHDSVTGWDSGESSIRDLAWFKAWRASSRVSTEERFRN